MKSKFGRLMLGLTALFFAVNINEDEPQGGSMAQEAAPAPGELTEENLADIADDPEADEAVEAEAEASETTEVAEPGTEEPAQEL